MAHYAPWLRHGFHIVRLVPRTWRHRPWSNVRKRSRDEDPYGQRAFDILDQAPPYTTLRTDQDDPDLWQIVPAVQHTDWENEEDIEISEPSSVNENSYQRNSERPLILDINHHGNCTLSLRIPAWRLVNPTPIVAQAINNSMHEHYACGEELHPETDTEVPEPQGPLVCRTALEGRTSNEPMWLERVRGHWVAVQPIPTTQVLWACV